MQGHISPSDNAKLRLRVLKELLKKLCGSVGAEKPRADYTSKRLAVLKELLKKLCVEMESKPIINNLIAVEVTPPIKTQDMNERKLQVLRTMLGRLVK